MVSPKKLQYYREENDLSIHDLSNRIKVSKRKIKLWELGELIPTEKEVKHLCDYYKIQESDLEDKNINIINIIISICLLLVFTLIGIIIHENIGFIYLGVTLTISFNVIMYIKTNYKKESDYKSLFSLELDKEKLLTRIKIYLIESLLISLLYTSIIIICYILKLDELIFILNIFKNNSYNFIITSIIISSALFLVSFVIELIFGEIIVKRKKVYEDEW